MLPLQNHLNVETQMATLVLMIGSVNRDELFAGIAHAFLFKVAYSDGFKFLLFVLI